jgi:transcriptional antiterminator NusG
MAFFALQVWTGSEGKFTSLAARKGALREGLRIWWPRRSLRIRRKGAWQESLASIFPGYLFVQADSIPPETFRALQSTSGFVRFLPSNDEILPLDRKDQEILTHFLSFGELVDRSVVVFDENSRIRVISGPLMGLEGQITRVDRRKGRAKVKLELYNDSFSVDFGFEMLESASGGLPPVRPTRP